MKRYLLLLVILLLPIKIYALDDLTLNSNAYIIYDNTSDTILASSNANNVVSIASLTKIMSAITVIENVNSLNERVTITNEMIQSVEYGAQVAGLQVGNILTVRELLYLALLASDADAINSLAIYTSGSIENFVSLMNNKASQLGLNNTHYNNPIGMDAIDNYSSASDVLNLLHYALDNHDFRTIFQTSNYNLSNGMSVTRDITHIGEVRNIDVSRIIGSKTGWTDAAGLCLAGNFNSHDHEYLFVTLGAPTLNFSDYLNIRDALTIIDYVDNNYDTYTLMHKGDLIRTLIVNNSIICNYNVYLDQDINMVLPKDYDINDFTYKDNLPDSIDYKTDKILGVVDFYYKDKKIYSEEIIINKNIKPNIKEILKTNIFLDIFIVIGIMLFILIIIFILSRRNIIYNKK